MLRVLIGLVGLRRLMCLVLVAFGVWFFGACFG